MNAFLIAKTDMDFLGWWQFCHSEGLPEGQSYDVLAPSNETGVVPSDGERLVERAGRLCYMSYGKGRKTNKEMLQNLIEAGHHSVLEHANYTFLFTKVSRSLTHELVRHRHFSFSQLSQRYVDHRDYEYIMPPEVKEVGMDAEWRLMMKASQTFYNELHEKLKAEKEPGDTASKKALRTVARSVLPNAIETKIVVTGNARSWREFIQKRATPAADPEIRALAEEVKKKLVAVAPNLFGDL